MDLAFWAQIEDSKAFIVLYHGTIMVVIVVVATIVCSLVAIFAIEALEDTVRSVKAWLRRPKKLNGSLA